MADDALCILPWIHLEVLPEGNAKICCVAKEAIRDQGRPMSVSEASLEEIRSTPYMRSVRKALADGRKIPVCGYCWEQEKRGETSQRQAWNEAFVHTTSALRERLAKGDDGAEPMPMEFLQISVGNKCNLACRMCNASYSSRIEEDPVHSRWAPPMDRDLEWGGPQGRRVVPLPQVPPRQRPDWVEGTPWFEQPQFVEKDMIGAGSTLRMLYVTGGEPFFVPAFDHILDEYVARGLAKDMVITLNSNLFHNERRVARAMESLLRFKHCHLSPSIDGYGAVYDYIRYPAKWAIVERNIRSVVELSRTHSNLGFMLTTVAQAYNCFNLVDLLRFADELSIECRPHVLDGPYYLKPQVLPRELRLQAAEALSSYAGSAAGSGPAAANRTHAARIAKYLETCEEPADVADLRRMFVAFTRELDQARGQSLERAIPELREIMTRFA